MSHSAKIKLQQLEQERERLRLMEVLVDSHAQELASALQRKRSHLAAIASLEPGVALAGHCYQELGELYSGADYRQLMTHVEYYQRALADRKRQLTERIIELRRQSDTEGAFLG
jgi:hypothetical protein